MSTFSIQKYIALGVSIIFLGAPAAYANCPQLSITQAKDIEEKGSFGEWKVYSKKGKIFSEPKRSILQALHPDFNKNLTSIEEGFQVEGSEDLKGKGLCIYYVTNNEPLDSRQYLGIPFIIYKDKVSSLKELAKLKVFELTKKNGVITAKDLEKLPSDLQEELKRDELEKLRRE